MIKELQERYIHLLAESEKIRLKYQGKPEEMNADELETWTRILDEADQIKAKIEAEKRDQALRKWLEEPISGIRFAQPSETKALPDSVEVARKFALSGKQALNEEELKLLADFQMKAFVKFVRGGVKELTELEYKALQADNPAGGGFLIAPLQFVTDLIADLQDQVFIRSLARVIRVERAQTLGVPTLQAEPSDPDWTGELTTVAEDTAIAFGQRELRPNPLSKMVRFSNRLIRNAAIDITAFIRERLAYKFGIAEEKAFLTGSGAGQPLGVFTASEQGISTARDIQAAAANAISADDLIKVKYALKAQYRSRPTVRWVLHRDILSTIRRLKDTTNNYIWASGLGPGGGFQGTPETILGIPYVESEYAPNSISSGNYSVLLGDFSYYWIADSLDFQIQVLVERFAETNQVAYIGRKETDGMPVLENAFARLKH